MGDVRRKSYLCTINNLIPLTTMRQTLLLLCFFLPLTLAAQGQVADVVAAQSDYQLIFSDEFDQPDGSRPDPTKWRASTRYSSTWNRWISDSPDVAYIQDGSLVCRAIPNPDTSVDNVPMITGAVETRGLFSFTYGLVKVRLRTNLLEGNFPAAWMMPQPPCDGWPQGGEIDIFESIDAERVAYHTVHSHWTFDLKHKTDPVSSFSKSNVSVNQWHIYSVEWLEDRLIFSIDSKVIGTYPRSDDENAIAQGQWPFNHPFYLILNQSVGDGSWGKAADTSQTYETRFDYIRVYQKLNPDAVIDIPNRSNRNVATNARTYYDLTGRPVATSRMQPGIYLNNARKHILK